MRLPDLPKLPQPETIGEDALGGDFDLFTADQMREYALAYGAAVREECAREASGFSMDPDACSVHPYIPFGEMSDDAQKVAHMTAQNIAEAIRSE